MCEGACVCVCQIQSAGLGRVYWESLYLLELLSPDHCIVMYIYIHIGISIWTF